MDGLFQECNLYVRLPQDDGVGGVTFKDEIFMPRIPCRMTKDYGGLRDEPLGIGGKHHWYVSIGIQIEIPERRDGVIIHYAVEINDSYYDVVQREAKNDEYGYLDHYEFMVELRE